MLRTTAHRAAVATLVATSLLGVSALAAASPATQTLRRGAYVNHTHVPGGYARSLTVDRAGRDHWLAAGRALYSLYPGDKKATREVYDVATSFGQERPIIRQLVPTVNGKGIDVISASCNSMQVFSIRSKARTLPKITPAMNVAQAPCQSGSYGGLADPSGAVALAKGRVAVLYAYNPIDGSPGRATVYIGKPGHTFHQALLPHYLPSNNAGFAAITRDPVNGSLYVAQSSYNGQLIVSYARTSHQKFRPPVTVDATLGYQRVTSIAASHKRVWIALAGPYHRDEGSYLATRKPSGKWSQVRRIPGTTHRYLTPLVTVAPGSKHASAWEADGYLDDSTYGIEYRHLDGNGIGSPHTYVSGTRGVDSIAGDWHGGLNFTYEA